MCPMWQSAISCILIQRARKQRSQVRVPNRRSDRFCLDARINLITQTFVTNASFEKGYKSSNFLNGFVKKTWRLTLSKAFHKQLHKNKLHDFMAQEWRILEYYRSSLNCVVNINFTYIPLSEQIRLVFRNVWQCVEMEAHLDLSRNNICAIFFWYHYYRIKNVW